MLRREDKGPGARVHDVVEGDGVTKVDIIARHHIPDIAHPRGIGIRANP